MERQLQGLNVAVGLKAEADQLTALQDKLSLEYPTLKAFAQLQHTVQMKAEWDDHNDLCQRHNKTAENLATTTELVYKLRDGLLTFSEAQTEKSSALSEDAEANTHKLASLSQTMRHNAKEAEKKLQEKQEQINNLVKSMEYKLSKLSTKDSLEEVRSSLDNYVSADDIIQLREEVLPKVADTQEQCTKMSQDNDDMRACISAFDVALCEKANKTGLHQLEARIRGEFVRTCDWRGISDELVTNDRARTAAIETVERDNEALQKNLLRTIGEIVTNITNEKLASYDKVAQNFQKFFNSEELSR